MTTPKDGWIGRHAAGGVALIARWVAPVIEGAKHRSRWRWESFGTPGVSVIVVGGRADCAMALEQAMRDIPHLQFAKRPKKLRLDDDRSVLV